MIDLDDAFEQAIAAAGRFAESLADEMRVDARRRDDDARAKRKRRD